MLVTMTLRTVRSFHGTEWRVTDIETRRVPELSLGASQLRGIEERRDPANPSSREAQHHQRRPSPLSFVLLVGQKCRLAVHLEAPRDQPRREQRAERKSTS